jgi:hypothetical protein
MTKMRNTYEVFVRKPEGKRPLEGTRCRWGDNTRMDSREIGLEDVDWAYVTQGRDQWRDLVNTVMNYQSP